MFVIPSSYDNTAHLLKLVQRMRSAQEKYAITRSPIDFVNSRYLQRKVDQALVGLQDLN